MRDDWNTVRFPIYVSWVAFSVATSLVPGTLPAQFLTETKVQLYAFRRLKRGGKKRRVRKKKLSSWNQYITYSRFEQGNNNKKNLPCTLEEIKSKLFGFHDLWLLKDDFAFTTVAHNSFETDKPVAFRFPMELEENWRTRRKPSEQGENHQQTQPTYYWQIASTISAAFKSRVIGSPTWV